MSDVQAGGNYSPDSEKENWSKSYNRTIIHTGLSIGAGSSNELRQILGAS